MRIASMLLLPLAFSVSDARGREAGAKLARGVVFHDENANRKLDLDEKPLPGVKVSNGHEIVTTGEAGRYELRVSDDTILFVIKPRGWRTPLNENFLPQFYYIHKPKGSPRSKFPGVAPTGPLPKSVDFPLRPQKEPDQFRAVLFGDTQPSTQREVDYIAHDVVEELIDTDASFGVTLGDVVFDNLSLFEPLARTIALIGIPWYNVIGNHDINLEAQNDRHSDETFERVFGPAYYAFDYGPAHFLVLDDIDWHMPEDGKKQNYRGGLGRTQMQFIRNDLAKIPHEQLVVLMMHIPLVDLHDRHELYRLIEKRPFCMSISGHTHHHEHRYIKKEDGWMGPEPHHHVINVTACGSWWRGAPDERGIPHAMMQDGAPNGYSIISFDGRNYKLDFKAAGRPAEYQMQIHAPEAVTADRLARTPFWANVFNGSGRSKVEFRVDDKGEWTTMKRVLKVDPGYRAAFDADVAIKEKKWVTLPKPKPSTHLWEALLPGNLATGSHLLHVRTTDRHGRTYHGRRTIRVEAVATSK